MNLLDAVVLGLVQALTEFLPVSSSGHLVLSEALLGVDTGPGVSFEVAVHFGTLLSVAILFRRELVRLTQAGFGLLAHPGDAVRRFKEDPDTRLLGLVIVGCIPAGIVGLTAKDLLESVFSAPRIVAGALLLTGVLLLASGRFARESGPLTLKRAIGIGLAQAVAITPGISRSGSTIATARLLGVEGELAARYSFLMALPLVLAATLMEARHLISAPPNTDALAAMGVGAAVAFVGGLASLSLLLGVVKRGWFPHFGWYCLAVGTVGLCLLP